MNHRKAGLIIVMQRHPLCRTRSWPITGTNSYGAYTERNYSNLYSARMNNNQWTTFPWIKKKAGLVVEQSHSIQLISLHEQAVNHRKAGLNGRPSHPLCSLVPSLLNKVTQVQHAGHVLGQYHTATALVCLLHQLPLMGSPLYLWFITKSVSITISFIIKRGCSSPM